MRYLLTFLALLALSCIGHAAEITLTWSDNSNNESGFTIERATGDGAFSVLANVPADTTRYSDVTAAPSTTYRYRVAAWNAAGQSAWSNEASTTTPELITIPAAPGETEAVPVVPPSYTPPEPTVTLNAGESLRIVATASVTP